MHSLTIGITCSNTRTINLAPPIKNGELVCIAKDGAQMLILQPSKSESVQGYEAGQAIYTDALIAAITLMAVDFGWQAACAPSGTWKTDVDGIVETITF
jgi:hypothetical protein